jgi:protoheme IX farnesyltransferase
MANKPGNNLGSYIELSKQKIMIPVSFTGFTGYFILKPEFSPGIFIVTAGILFLAISASVMNQIQEIDIDSSMKRTRNRPLPTGRIGIREARLYFYFCLAAGSFLLFAGGNLVAALTGLFTVLWYNGIYTNAKRLTEYAIIPGALTGALPPFIGWIAAGGAASEHQIISVGLLFFVGQIPHFLLLVLKYGNEYEKAEIPTLLKSFKIESISRITFGLSLATVIIAVYLFYSELKVSGGLLIILLIASVLLVWQFSGLLRNGIKENCMKYFHSLDRYFLVVLILLITDKIIS